MKRVSLFLIGLLIWSANFASEDWNRIDNAQSPNTKVKLLNTTKDVSVIQFNINGYKLHKVKTPNGVAFTVKIPDGAPMQIKGAPNLPRLSTSLIIPNDKQMQAEIQYSDYIEINNIEIAPSKGVITRNIDPSTVAYTYGKVYTQNSFFPKNLSKLNKPYIIRNYRGAAVWVQPVQYNPVTKTLRIYKTIVVKVSPTGKPAQINALLETKGNHLVTPEFQDFYRHNFLNYTTFQTKYTPIEEGTPGRMLIISYGDFMTAMQPFVDWKNQKGIYTEMVDVSTIGDASAIKSYVQDYYNNHSDFCYLLLVGDAAQVPASSTGAGDSDNNYGYLAGNDHRIDIFVGRFSAESTADVTTQVDRTIHYERDVTSAESWMQYGLCIASDQGGDGNGDDDESDAEHEDNIKADYLNYGYTGVATCYQSNSGETDTTISNAINTHCGVISYTGHGDVTMWYSVNPNHYTNTDVNALTNENELPFIFSVACVIGDFVDNTCFSEAWQRATNDGKPTGAIANIGSTINQSWDSPMDAQDEMVDILVESYSNNIKRTFGGLVANGWGMMIDDYGSDGEKMADTWTVFGDASVMVRTKQPQDMTISHADGINVGATSFNVDCDAEGALVSITKDNVIFGTGYVSGGSVDVQLDSTISDTGNILVTVTAYNKVTYQQLVPIVQPTDPPVCNFSGTPTTITAGESVQFTDSSTEYPTSWSWTFDGADQTNSTERNPAITYSTPGTYDVSLTVTNNVGSDSTTKTAYITVNEISDPPVADFVADNTTIVEGQTVNFTDLSTNMPTSWSWSFEGGTPTSSTEQNPSVVYNTAGTYNVSLTATNSIGDGTETKTAYITVTPPTYCDAGAADKWEYIDGVTCGTINNQSTGWSTGGYGDYTSMSTNVTTGGTVDITVTIGNVYSADQVYAWVDWNVDGDFNDAGEKVFNSSTNGQASYSFTINIPDTAPQKNTRLRIRLNDSSNGSNNTPCGTSDYGEVEDYTLSIFPEGIKNNQIAELSIFPNPNNGYFQINLPNNIDTYIQIFDITGKTVWAKQTTQNQIAIDLSKVEKGIYFVRIQNDELTTVQKIVIQ